MTPRHSRSRRNNNAGGSPSNSQDRSSMDAKKISKQQRKQLRRDRKQQKKRLKRQKKRLIRQIRRLLRSRTPPESNSSSNVDNNTSNMVAVPNNGINNAEDNVEMNDDVILIEAPRQSPIVIEDTEEDNPEVPRQDQLIIEISDSGEESDSDTDDSDQESSLGSNTADQGNNQPNIEPVDETPNEVVNALSNNEIPCQPNEETISEPGEETPSESHDESDRQSPDEPLNIPPNDEAPGEAKAEPGSESNSDLEFAPMTPPLPPDEDTIIIEDSDSNDVCPEPLDLRIIRNEFVRYWDISFLLTLLRDSTRIRVSSKSDTDDSDSLEPESNDELRPPGPESDINEMDSDDSEYSLVIAEPQPLDLIEPPEEEPNPETMNDEVLPDVLPPKRTRLVDEQSQPEEPVCNHKTLYYPQFPHLRNIVSQIVGPDLLASPCKHAGNCNVVSAIYAENGTYEHEPDDTSQNIAQDTDQDSEDLIAEYVERPTVEIEDNTVGDQEKEKEGEKESTETEGECKAEETGETSGAEINKSNSTDEEAEPKTTTEEGTDDIDPEFVVTQEEIAKQHIPLVP